VLASSAGYGFVVRLENLHSRNKGGKVVLTIPKGAHIVPASPVGAASKWLAAVSSDGRLLVFPVAELPELARGKGNKILALPSKAAAEMVAICALAPDQALQIVSGKRQMTLKPKDLGHYVAVRGRRGSALPRGWRKVDRMQPEPG
jgi:topoisomerase-4 subunit A